MLLDGPYYTRANDGLRINRVEMSDNDTFWCRADVLETGESRDFPITVVISSKISLLIQTFADNSFISQNPLLSLVSRVLLHVLLKRKPLR